MEIVVHVQPADENIVAGESQEGGINIEDVEENKLGVPDTQQPPKKEEPNEAASPLTTICISNCENTCAHVPAVFASQVSHFVRTISLLCRPG